MSVQCNRYQRRDRVCISEEPGACQIVACQSTSVPLRSADIERCNEAMQWFPAYSFALTAAKAECRQQRRVFAVARIERSD